jgi:excisionase family DNA binding protein
MSSNIRLKRICQFCNAEFIAKTTVTKYCGDNCAKRAYKKRKREEKIETSNKETINVIQAPLVELQAKEYLSIKDISVMLNISRTTIWRLIKNKQLKSAKLGRRVIIRKSDLNDLFK